MTREDMKNIIEHQVMLQLIEKNMKRSDLSDKEYIQWCYDMAVKLLVEL